MRSTIGRSNWRRSENGYYAGRKCPESKHKRENARLTTQIQDIFVARRRVYGNPRIHAEIADELIVSINTIRTHIQHIYQKLGVHNRLAAIEAARRLHLFF